MSNLTKKDVKDAVVEVLEPFATAIQKDMADFRKKVAKGFEGTATKKEVLDLKAEVMLVKQDMRELRTEFREMKEGIDKFLSKIDKYISLYEEQKLELSSLTNQVRRLETQVSEIRDKVGLKK